MAIKQARSGYRRPEAWWSYPPLLGVAVLFLALVGDITVGRALTIGGIGLAAVAVVVPFAWPAHALGSTFTRTMAACLALLVAAATGWLAVAGTDPLGTWMWLPLAMALPWIGYERLVRAADDAYAQYRPAAPVVVDGTPVALPVAPPRPGFYARALDAADMTKGIRLERVERSPSGSVETLYLAATSTGRDAVTYRRFVADIPRLALTLSGMFEREKGLTEFGEDRIVPEQVSAHRWRLHVTVAAVMGARSIPYVSRGPAAPLDPLDVGEVEDERPLLLRQFDDDGSQHMAVRGKTGSGKDVLADCVIAEVTRSPARKVWVATSHKFMPMVWPWLRPWFEGRTTVPVLDWVATGQTETLKMLADAYHLVALLNEDLDEAPVRIMDLASCGLAVLLNESSITLRHPAKIETFDGRKLNASELWSEIKQLGRSAQVAGDDFSQYGLMIGGGSAGSEQSRNTGIGVALQVRRAHDATAVIPDLPPHMDAVKLRNYQQYVQAEDPDTGTEKIVRAKAYALFGSAVDPIAVTHAGYQAQGRLAHTDALEHYAGRWDSDRQPELVRRVRTKGLSWPAPHSDPHDVTAAVLSAAETGTLDPDLLGLARAMAGEATPDEVGALVEKVNGRSDLAELPDQWDDEGFDVMAAVTGRPEQAEQPDPGPAGLVADTSKLEEIAARVRAEADAAARAAGRIPDPMGAILAVLDHPRAAEDLGEYAATEDLAELLGRVGPAVQGEARDRAIEQLGADINRQTGLTSERRKYRGRRRSGYTVSRLREAAARLH